MLGSLALAVRKEKNKCWEAWYWQFVKKKLLLGNLVLQFGKKTRCWEAWYWQLVQKKKLGSSVLEVKCNIDQNKRVKLARFLTKKDFDLEHW